MSPKRFDTTRVSVDLHKMISDLENAAMAVAVSQGREATETAFTLLCYSRKFLYEYLEDELEIPEGTPSTLLRFT